MPFYLESVRKLAKNGKMIAPELSEAVSGVLNATETASLISVAI